MTTEAAPAPARRPAARRPGTVDRWSVVLFSTTAMLALLALLAWQLRAAHTTPAPRQVIEVRRVLRTTVIETVVGGGSAGPGGGGTSVSQSVSAPAPASPAVAMTAPAPVTRTS